LNGSEQERSALTQDKKINTGILKITKEDRQKDAQAEADAAQARADAQKTHYGKFIPGASAYVRSMAVPTPRGSKADVKAGPPDRITISFKASAGDLREFYAAALTKYSWKPAGSCWEREHPSSKKSETLCLEASNNTAVIQITEK